MLMRLARIATAAALVAACGLATPVVAQDGAPSGGGEAPQFKPFAEVSKGYEKVISTADGQSFYTLFTRKRDGGMLAELPRGWESQKQFIAMTVASGESYAGLQTGDLYVYWKRFDNRLMLMEPNVGTRSNGDPESKSSVKNLFTDRVILDVPIVCMGPNGQPVIDFKALLAGRIREVFTAGGGVGRVGRGALSANASLATIKDAKAFPKNVEITYEMPTTNGRIQAFHYSISSIPDSTGYQPRVADDRVGYFTTVYRDLGKFTDREKWVRYINRWHVEKRDPKLKMSPPKEPIVFYIDTAVPVRYRTAVREGVLRWNKAFEKVGIKDAIEVYQQDEATNQHMDKDPEDVRYNFIRWLSNDEGTAIGPSRTHPLTGQILDADVVLTDGWIRHFWVQYNEIMPEIAMENLSGETIAWLDKNPQWDPRVRLADPGERDAIIAQRARRGVLAYGGHPIAMHTSGAQEHDSTRLAGAREFDGLIGRSSQFNGLCLAAKGKAFDMATMQMTMEIMDMDEVAKAYGIETGAEGEPAEGEKGEGKKKEKGDSLDGIPDWFVGPLLADLVSHEVGHTLGLRHNFKASGQWTLEEVNSEKVKGKSPITASIMDYTPVNFAIKDGKATGDFAMIDVGKYDYWAIEYGYTLDDPKKVLEKVGEPGHEYGTDEDVGGPDPLAQRYDFSKNPIDYAKSQMELAKYHRERLLEKFAKNGESWAKVRRGYTISLGMQTRGLSMLSPWVGGAHVNRDHKGDPNGREPIVVVPAAQQREALKWVIENSFFDESFGLTPELLQKMTVQKWLDQGGGRDAAEDATWPVHDRIAGIQSSVLTMLMNPTTVRRVFDNEFRVKAEEDVLTLPEMLDTIHASVWSELEKGGSGKFTARKPMISSLRRNLQREYLDRMIELTFPGSGSGEAYKPVSNLAMYKLRGLKDRIARVLDDKGAAGNLDAYTLAHLTEARTRIEKALDAGYTLNGGGGMGGMGGFIILGNTPETVQPTQQAPALQSIPTQYLPEEAPASQPVPAPKQ
ncbi:MAG TPA: zinc-dependent metalloprotease [Phycisphaerales bacterium]|nr:zinc-dependent metalloprotease [Phycisphaerales bacterium]